MMYISQVDSCAVNLSHMRSHNLMLCTSNSLLPTQKGRRPSGG